MADEEKAKDTAEAPVKDAEVEVPETPPSSEEDVEKEASEDTQPEEVDAPKEDIVPKEHYDSVKGKVSSLEKRANEYAEKAGAFETINELAARNPEFKRAIYQAMLGAGKIKPDEVPADVFGEVPQTAVPTPQGLTPEHMAALEEATVQKRVREEEQRKTRDKQLSAALDLEERHKDITEGTESVVKARRELIGAKARAVSSQRGVSFEEALEDAYVYELHPERLKEEGMLEGLAKAQQVKSTVGTGAGSVPKHHTSGTVSEDQRAMAKEFGLEDDDLISQLSSTRDISIDDYKRMKSKK